MGDFLSVFTGLFCLGAIARSFHAKVRDFKGRWWYFILVCPLTLYLTGTLLHV